MGRNVGVARAGGGAAVREVNIGFGCACGDNANVGRGEEIACSGGEAAGKGRKKGVACGSWVEKGIIASGCSYGCGCGSEVHDGKTVSDTVACLWADSPRAALGRRVSFSGW
jgi:hypothetical protein